MNTTGSNTGAREATPSEALFKFVAGLSESQFVEAAMGEDGETLLNMLVGALGRLVDAEEQIVILACLPAAEGEWVLVPRRHLECLAGLYDKHTLNNGGPDKVKWEGEWHEGPLATAYLRLVDEVSNAAQIMLSAAPHYAPTPPEVSS